MAKIQRYHGGLCSVEGCEEKAKAKGMCERHYQAYYWKKRSRVSEEPEPDSPPVIPPQVPQEAREFASAMNHAPGRGKIPPKKLVQAMKMADRILKQPEIRAVLVAVIMEEMLV